MMKNITFLQLSNERLRYLAKLKQKKYRLQEDLVIVEGKRTLEQLFAWVLNPGNYILWKVNQLFQQR